SEALNGVVRTFPEALRFPEPKRPFQVRLRKRAANQAYVEIWTYTIEPGSRFVHRATISPQNVLTVLRNGEPAEKVDLLLLGDGYSATEMEKFEAATRRSVEALFALEPFASRQEDFNVWGIAPPAAESGVSRPRSGMFRDSPLGASYNTLDSERYVLTLQDRDWRDVAAAAPYDFVMILVNSEKYGGGGIFNLYSTAAAGSDFFPYLLVHEFGHHFAGLGDEYYTSDVAYEDFQGEMQEPWEPNITALLDPENFKWADLVEAGTPLPTPWKKEAFEKLSHSIQERRRELRKSGAPEADLERLFSEEREQMTALLGSEAFAGQVGAFEGASYQPKGLFRPQADCIMFTRDEVGFCAVCARAINQIIDLYTR
ncbi:MAG: M64 family metallopeptidase, partial [Thermoanaerobaculia bacterium]